MSEPIWYSLDFGHAYIRVARARASDDAAATTPELVQFGGRPALPNLALLSPDGRTLEAVGAAITDHELDIDALDRLYEAASLDDSPQSEGGRVARLLLAHVVAVLQREHAFQPNDPIVEAFVALPIAERNAEQTRQALEARLSEAGLATTTAVASAIGALVHYCHGRPAPGRYLVIDNGYVWTRFALVECSADGLPQVVAQTQNSSGGQSFDKALVDYFARTLGWDKDIASERQPAIIAFKHRFAAAWSDGRPMYQEQILFDGQSAILAMDPSLFVSPAVAESPIGEFRRAADDFVRDHASDGNFSGIVLAGGGAHWPFVRDWAGQQVEPGKVLIDEYPEQAVVRGLPRVAALSRPAPRTGVEAPASQQPRPDVGQVPDTRPRPVKPLLSPGPTAVVEFLFGIFGFLGLGWFLGPKKVVTGFALLLGWWLLLLLLLLLGVLSALGDRPAVALALLPVWLGVPLASSMLAYRAVRRMAAAALR